MITSEKNTEIQYTEHSSKTVFEDIPVGGLFKWAGDLCRKINNQTDRASFGVNTVSLSATALYWLYPDAPVVAVKSIKIEVTI